MTRVQVPRKVLIILTCLLAFGGWSSWLCWRLVRAQGHEAATPDSAPAIAALPALESTWAGAAPASPAGGVYSVGETLEYSVSWAKFLTAAKITASTIERRQEQNIDSYHVRVEGQTIGLVNTLYPSTGIYEAYISSATLRPFRAFDELKTGSKLKKHFYWLEPGKSTAFLTDGRKIPVPDNTVDMASLLYALRNLELTPGKSATVAMLENNKLTALVVEAQGSQSVTTTAGTFLTMRLALKGSDPKGGISDRYNMRLLLTTDSRRLPVLFIADALIGSLRVELTSYSKTP